MKKRSSNAQTKSPVTAAGKKPRLLNKFLGELRALYNEAITILDRLLIDPTVDIVCSLCAQFRILQENFVLCYRAAQAYAISALGVFEATLYFP